MGLGRFWLFIHGHGCWLIAGFCGDDYEFYIWLLFLLLTPLTCLLLSLVSCKRINDGKKETTIAFNLNFILGFMTILKWKTFSWTSRRSHISQTRSWSILVIFGAKKFEGRCLSSGCFQLVIFSREDVSRRNGWLPGPRTYSACVLIPSSQKKRVLLIAAVAAEW